MKALSIRQPWAWLIVNGLKNVENRSRTTNIRGPVLIHASAGMTRAEYEACQLYIFGWCDFRLPAFEQLERGGIVGQATILDCVKKHPSEWFCGPFGWVVAEAKPLPFKPCKGSLNFFNVE